jgi:spheroidene monooxygenase
LDPSLRKKRPAAAPIFRAISAVIGQDPNVIFKIGIGEVPLLHQVTFSIWDDPESMLAFAYRSSSHGEAVRRVRDGRWFKEELYARFRVLHWDGTWDGRDPLRALVGTPA